MLTQRCKHFVSVDFKPQLSKSTNLNSPLFFSILWPLFFGFRIILIIPRHTPCCISIKKILNRYFMHVWWFRLKVKNKVVNFVFSSSIYKFKMLFTFVSKLSYHHVFKSWVVNMCILQDFLRWNISPSLSLN